jgi:hypothetical protein
MLGFGAADTIGTTTVAEGRRIATFTTYDATGAETAGWGAFGTLGSGSVTVTKLTATSVSGTFTFSLAPFTAATSPKAVTNGAFNVDFLDIK